MYNSQDVAQSIKKMSKDKNITIKKLLEDVGLGFNTMSNMKTSMPKADNLAKIADYLDCSVDYLLGRTDNPETNKRKGGVSMLDDKEAKELMDAVLSNLNLNYQSDQPGINALSKQFAEIATKIAVLTLQEYEKRKEHQDS